MSKISSRRHAWRLRGALCGMLFAVAEAAGAQSPCPLPGQQPVLTFQMFFGRNVHSRAPVSTAQWNSFLRHTLTPRFPDGFTVYDAYGQWLDPKTQSISRESTKVVIIAAADTAAVRAKVAEVSEDYRRLFHQQSVGIITSPGCAAF
jgi:hypothetical protein